MTTKFYQMFRFEEWHNATVQTRGLFIKKPAPEPEAEAEARAPEPAKTLEPEAEAEARAPEPAKTLKKPYSATQAAAEVNALPPDASHPLVLEYTANMNDIAASYEAPAPAPEAAAPSPQPETPAPEAEADSPSPQPEGAPQRKRARVAEPEPDRLPFDDGQFQPEEDFRALYERVTNVETMVRGLCTLMKSIDAAVTLLSKPTNEC